MTNRRYKIYLVTPEPSEPLTVDAEDVELVWNTDNEGNDSDAAAFNFVIAPDPKIADSKISVAWVPFEMVRAIIS